MFASTNLILWLFLTRVAASSFYYGVDRQATLSVAYGTAGNASEPVSRQLSSIGSDSFTSLSHPRFPNHAVRVKQTQFCDPTVNVYTGYLDVAAGSKHLFFYFFESRRDPAKDDVMMWINGATGVQVLGARPPWAFSWNLHRYGQHFVQWEVWNPYGWNEEANIFFLDQPVGVGFSYADYSKSVGTTKAAAKDVHAFISIFFETFTQFAGRPLHLAGESYGGRYLPVFASEIWDQNLIAHFQGQPTINLQSVLIGNGITDVSTCVSSIRVSSAIGWADRRPVIGDFGKAVPRPIRSGMWHGVAGRAFPVYRNMWRNVYDISKPCEGELCYKEIAVIKAYLDQPSTRELLGVSPSAPTNFSSCSSNVGTAFASHMDKWAVHTQDYVANLLERGVRILLYAGTLDWQCNWVANVMWVDKLEWNGQEGWKNAEWRKWKGGKVKESKEGQLVFATVNGAGHMMSPSCFIF
ncbi:hypothetical protein NLJ89_g127 [Agrocybe chaxingu]|uniref:Carboxypeptidase n=1 Tax=Agrocybe chaxingu TaxID=84603 RepID=A0A9W8N2G6_9AGAR|nr:hypothetical protein NLJ89_g127 [Agrocybe chaxingu]